MKRWSFALLALAGTLALAVAACAPDRLFVQPAQPSGLQIGPQDVRLIVETNSSLTTPRLFIPRSLLVAKETETRKLGAAGGWNTIGAGLALTASFITCGFWLVGRGRQRIGAAMIALTLLSVGAGAALADFAPPRWPWERRAPRPVPPLNWDVPLPDPLPPPIVNSLALPASVQLPATIQIELVDAGDAIRLAIPSPPLVLIPTTPAPGSPPPVEKP